MNHSRYGFLGTTTIALGALAVVLSAAPKTLAQEAAKPVAEAPKCEGLPPGKHSLLEKMTAAFELTCEQQLKVEPLLHAEEQVSKPLLAFAAFTPEEKKDMMQVIKVAARKQIKPLLTADQQKKMDEDIDSVSKKGNGTKGGKKGGAKKEVKPVDPFEAEEKLCAALAKYSALSDEQKHDMILQVKKASRREGAPQLTEEQGKKIDAEIQQMSPKAAGQ